ncbi:MAG: CDP-6-deoxy-delta-3,4-glucoseen reductase, partial [Xanthomonadales bacterium]|nr:CDP-6-deoxy-delta-3,4-glucoseen reductase [Xanthomonadales bacterium]
MKKFNVTLSQSGRVFEVNEGESVLSAALRQGVMLPYSCKNGTCGSCKAVIESGEVHYPFHPPLALSRPEIADGYALLCQAEPLEDLRADAREIEAVRDIPVRMFPARVIETEQLAPHVMKLTLKLPRAQRLQFLAGQYVDVLLPGGKRRAFSIASAPQREDEIELHIRHVEGGDFTGWVFEELKLRDILRLEGPLGNFFIRNEHPDKPMILMAGGTGFAPLKSMVEDLQSQGDQRSIHLFWGAQSAAELYMEDLPLAWAENHENLKYTGVVADDSGLERHQRGMVHEAVLSHYPDLSGFELYMSGPPAMIDTARAAFFERGLPERCLYYDSFEFGIDVPVRILARPH